MSKRVGKYKHMFHVLADRKLDPKVRNAILDTGKPDLIHAICEILFNLINQTFNVSCDCKKKLKSREQDVQNLLSKKRSILQKRKILKHGKGAMLPLILGPALSLLDSLF